MMRLDNDMEENKGMVVGSQRRRRALVVDCDVTRVPVSLLLVRQGGRRALVVDCDITRVPVSLLLVRQGGLERRFGFAVSL